jgi:hypothetical protein
VDIYLFHRGGLLVGVKGKERWFDYPAEALTPTKANLRLLKQAIPRGINSSVHRVFLFNEYYWLSTDLNVYTVAESQAKDILFRNFTTDEGAKRPVGIVSKTTSFFVGRALDADVLEVIQSLFPRAYVYSGSLALGDYWVSQLLPSAAQGNEAGEKRLALLAVKGTGLVYYGQVGFLELVTALPALGRLSLEKGAQDVARLKEEVVASLTETLSLMAESQPKGIEVFFPETAQALARIGVTVDPSAIHGPVPADFRVPPEYTYAKPTVLITGRGRLNPEYIVALLGVIAYFGSFAYEKIIEAQIARTSQELSLLEAKASEIRRKEQLLRKLKSEVLILKQSLPAIDVFSKKVTSFLDSYAERVPSDYKITRLEYAEGSFKIALSFQGNVAGLVKSLASTGDVEIESYKRVGDRVEVGLIYRPR